MSMEFLLPLFRILVLLFVILRSFAIIGRTKHPVTTGFFAFAMVSTLLSDLYWLTYDLMRPGVRMPFAANEICEWGLFLLLGAAAATIGGGKRVTDRKCLLAAALISAVNAMLWIGWSREWLQDICTGAALCYYLSAVFYGMKRERFFTRKKLLFFGVITLAVLVTQAVSFTLPQDVVKATDILVSVLLLVGAGGLTVYAASALRKKQYAMAYYLWNGVFAWAIFSMYMSAGSIYLIFLAVSVCCNPLLLYALEKEGMSQ
ncbi:MAG: hypothetical protein K5739_02895 [Lachnospiraceae bacterium]|nr:hypothetical protein [Lachnospiraceae bacterium]